jgi:hypothetical protein
MIIGEEADVAYTKMREKERGGKRQKWKGEERRGEQGGRHRTRKQRKATSVQVTRPEKWKSYEELGGWFDRIGTGDEGEESIAEVREDTGATVEQEEIDRAIEEKERRDKELGDLWEAEWTKKPLKPGKAKEVEEAIVEHK